MATTKRLPVTLGQKITGTVLAGWVLLVGWGVFWGLPMLFTVPEHPAREHLVRGNRYDVKLLLRDPESAEFDGEFYGRPYDGLIALCGRVNAKNGFGGYTGYHRFVALPGGVAVIEQAGELGELWNRSCR